MEVKYNKIWHPFTPFSQEQTVLTHAEGAYVFDAQGNRYFDATSSWWCNIHGHCHPRLVKALSEQAKKLDQILFAQHTHPGAIELADKLLTYLGPGFKRIFFSDNGSTSVEAALKMALQFWHGRSTPKSLFVSFEGAYHGDTLGAVGVSGTKNFHSPFEGATIPSLKLPQPCQKPNEEHSHSDCESFVMEKAQEIVREHENDIAALIVEPLVLGAGGFLFYSPKLLEELVQLFQKKDILVIFDEVLTGFGRTGTFLAKEQLPASIQPDIVCLSKGLTSGMLPLAVTAVNEKIESGFRHQTFYHGHTFSGNALGCAVALESLRIFEEEKTLSRNLVLINEMQRLGNPLREISCVGTIRQKGMIWVAALRPAENAWKIAHRLWDKGIWVRPLNNLIYLIPPYCTTSGELERFFCELGAELREIRV